MPKGVVRLIEELTRSRAGSTAIFMVDMDTRSLTYRGYPAKELCRRHTFEEVAYLLWHGELPTQHEVYAQKRAERAQRAVPAYVAEALGRQPSAAGPMDILRTAVTLLGARDPARDQATPATIRARALRLFAVLPTIIATDQRRRRGLGAVAPRDDLGYAANFLYMTFGKVPEPQVVAAFDKSLILCAEHSGGVPPLTNRAPVPTASLYGAVAAAIGALGEPPRGGGGSVHEILSEIASPDNARPWLDEALADGRTVPGFGYRLEKSGDSRVAPMRSALAMVAALRGGQHLIEVYDALEAAMFEAKGLRPMLDYPTQPAYRLIGFDTATYTPILAAARLPGWTAHLADRIAVNRPVRPLAAYATAERHRAI